MVVTFVGGLQSTTLAALWKGLYTNHMGDFFLSPLEGAADRLYSDRLDNGEKWTEVLE